jgi:hypothetical protein
MGRRDMPEMSGKDRDAGIDVAALAVRVDERGDRKGMTVMWNST